VRLTSRTQAGKQRARMRGERDMRPSPARLPARVWRAAVAALAALLGAYAVAQGIVRLPVFDRWVRERVAGELRARFGDGTVAPGVTVDPLFRAAFGPVTIPGASAGEPLARIERIDVRPRLLALLSGRLEPASIRLTGVRIAAGRRGRALRALLDRRARRGQMVSEVRRAGAPRPRPAASSPFPAIHVRGLVVTFPAGGRTVEIGPVDADVTGSRSPAGTSLAMRLPKMLNWNLAAASVCCRSSQRGPRPQPKTSEPQISQPGLGLRPRPEPMAYRTVVILRPPLRRVARTCQA